MTKDEQYKLDRERLNTELLVAATLLSHRKNKKGTAGSVVKDWKEMHVEVTKVFAAEIGKIDVKPKSSG